MSYNMLNCDGDPRLLSRWLSTRLTGVRAILEFREPAELSCNKPRHVLSV
jgi:hypothetical protein